MNLVYFDNFDLSWWQATYTPKFMNGQKDCRMPIDGYYATALNKFLWSIRYGSLHERIKAQK